MESRIQFANVFEKRSRKSSSNFVSLTINQYKESVNHTTALIISLLQSTLMGISGITGSDIFTNNESNQK